MGTSPEADAASNLPLTNSLAEELREDHDKSLQPAGDGMVLRIFRNDLLHFDTDVILPNFAGAVPHFRFRNGIGQVNTE